MKKKIIVIVIEIIIISVLIVLTILQANKNYYKLTIEEEPEPENVMANINIEYNKISKLKDKSIIYTISGCINKYLAFISTKNANALLELLDEKYIEKNNITNENVVDKLGNLEKHQKMELKEIYYEYESEIVVAYYVKASIRDDNTNNIENNEMVEFYDPDLEEKEKTIPNKKEIYLKIRLDYQTMGYKVYPLEKQMYSKIIENVE